MSLDRENPEDADRLRCSKPGPHRWKTTATKTTKRHLPKQMARLVETNVSMVTTKMLGEFKENEQLRRELLSLIRG